MTNGNRNSLFLIALSGKHNIRRRGSCGEGSKKKTERERKEKKREPKFVVSSSLAKSEQTVNVRGLQ